MRLVPLATLDPAVNEWCIKALLWFAPMFAFDPLALVAFDSDPAAMPSPEHPVQLPIKSPLSLGALLKAD